MSSWGVVYERTATGWSAYVPALPGVAVAAATRDETEQLVAEAIALHLEGMAEDGLPIPEPDTADVGHVQPALPASTTAVTTAATVGRYGDGRDRCGQLRPQEGTDTMAKVAAFHSKLPGTTKYHDNNSCTEGNNIEQANRVAGPGGLKKCDHCSRLG